MPSKALPERIKTLGTSKRNEAVVLLSSASGRTVAFIIDIGRGSIPFGNPAARRFSDKEDILDILLDGSFLPSDTGEHGDIEDMEFSDTVFDLGNRLRRSLQVRGLTGKHLSDLEYFLQHVNMTEN